MSQSDTRNAMRSDAVQSVLPLDAGLCERWQHCALHNTERGEQIPLTHISYFIILLIPCLHGTASVPAKFLVEDSTKCARRISCGSGVIR